MIEIKAKWNESGGYADVSIKAHGSANEIIAEATSIVLGLPKKLADELPLEAFAAFCENVKRNSHALIETEDDNNANITLN